MLLKLILKIWPSLIPITIYILWTFVIEGFLLQKLFKRGKIIETKREKKEYVMEKPGHFSLRNKKFVFVLYASFITAIVTLIYFALN
ncbi:MAG: hypothetical protein ISQ34_00985 [Rickettsiales bacterium]|nr:hypothetical protein [Rickettsiales bacterium]